LLQGAQHARVANHLVVARARLAEADNVPGFIGNRHVGFGAAHVYPNKIAHAFSLFLVPELREIRPMGSQHVVQHGRDLLGGGAEGVGQQRFVERIAVAVDGGLHREQLVGLDRGQQAAADRRQRLGRQRLDAGAG
jgi:hypothetical protein